MGRGSPGALDLQRMASGISVSGLRRALFCSLGRRFAGAWGVTALKGHRNLNRCGRCVVSSQVGEWPGRSPPRRMNGTSRMRMAWRHSNREAGFGKLILPATRWRRVWDVVIDGVGQVRLGRGLQCLVLVALVTGRGAEAPTAAELEAFNRSHEGYCQTIEDFLDTGAHAVVHDDPTRDSVLLKWGREQGIPGLEPPVPLARRREALNRVYRELKQRYLPEATIAEEAPDAGVQVTVGEPRVVMWAPEGKTADIAGEKYRLRHLGGSIAAEGRWGQYMFPQISRLRTGQLVVQVYVGGDGPGGRNYLYYVSDDRGRTWQHYTVYQDDAERPANEIALRLPDGEELRGPLDRDYPPIDLSGLKLKSYGGFTRVGDLPKERQGVPIYTRKPGQEQWTREVAFWDPDLLVSGRLPSPIQTSEAHVVHLRDGSMVTAVWREAVMSDIRPDGTVNQEGENHQIWRSFDRGRTWKCSGTIPRLRWWTGFPHPPADPTVRAHLLAFPNGRWVAAYRCQGLYYSSGGPLILSGSNDEGRTWSKPRAIRVPGANPLGVVLQNGIGVLSYQRPGVFLTFCGDGMGERWGNDVTLVKPWRHQRNENSCCNGSFVVTGPDRFVYAYTKWDVRDPWGQPRQAVLAQEFIVSRKTTSPGFPGRGKPGARSRDASSRLPTSHGRP